MVELRVNSEIILLKNIEMFHSMFTVLMFVLYMTISITMYLEMEFHPHMCIPLIVETTAVSCDAATMPCCVNMRILSD